MHDGKGEKNWASINTTPHINGGKEDTEGQGTVCPLHQEKKKSMGRGTCSTMCLTFVMRIERSLLKNASGASKFFFTGKTF
mmetsp:Transcript_11428/g.29780  ORF Transcript_11428/g.29780 Transcript_11428/m.29780 type:complete len:81 (+) Transcript_11428:2995-3237(+)